MQLDGVYILRQAVDLERHGADRKPLRDLWKRVIEPNYPGPLETETTSKPEVLLWKCLLDMEAYGSPNPPGQATAPDRRQLCHAQASQGPAVAGMPSSGSHAFHPHQ